MSPESLEKFLTVKMPFGKHTDQLICHLPANYLAWFARVGFPHGEIGELLELMHEIDHNNLRHLLSEIS